MTVPETHWPVELKVEWGPGYATLSSAYERRYQNRYRSRFCAQPQHAVEVHTSVFIRPRSHKAQLDIAWKELQSAVLADAENGVLLSAMGTKLLLDGVPMDSVAPGRAFAQLISGAGIASLHFLPQVTLEEFSRFVQAFPAGSAKPESLLGNLKDAMGATAGIRINEVRFIREDSASARQQDRGAAHDACLGANAAELKAWFDDPQKLLQLILAAETSRGDSGGARVSGGPIGAARNTSGETNTEELTSLGMSVTAVASDLTEDQFRNVLGLLKKVAQKARESNSPPEPLSFQKEVSALPARAQFSIQAALASLAEKTPNEKADRPTLLKLAERLAVQFALEKVESGDVRAGAVHQMFIRMSRELEGLREILGSHEEKLSRAGIAVESYADTLSDEVWSQVSDEHKKAALLSAEVWCCPPQVVRQFVEELSRQGDDETAYSILQNYGACITGADAETRRCAAIGIAEIADLYGRGDGRLLIEAIGSAASQMVSERDKQMHALVSAAFVRLTQEAVAQACYPAILRALELLSLCDQQRPGVAQGVRPRLGIEDRLPNFIERVLITGRIPAGLTGLLRSMPQRAATVLASQFNQCAYHDECETLIEVAASLGPGWDSELEQGIRNKCIDGRFGSGRFAQPFGSIGAGEMAAEAVARMGSVFARSPGAPACGGRFARARPYSEQHLRDA